VTTCRKKEDETGLSSASLTLISYAKPGPNRPEIGVAQGLAFLCRESDVIDVLSRLQIDPSRLRTEAERAAGDEAGGTGHADEG
jgi:hypothetical protein